MHWCLACLSFLLVGRPRSDGLAVQDPAGVDWIRSKATVRKKPLGRSSPALQERGGELAGSPGPSNREGGRIRGANSSPAPTSRKQSARNLQALALFPGRNAPLNRLTARWARKQSQREKSGGSSGAASAHELRLRR